MYGLFYESGGDKLAQHARKGVRCERD